MAEVTLFRVPGTKLFVNCDPPETAGTAAAASFCFFHSQDTTRQTITFTLSLKEKGVYAFLPMNTANPFATLAAYLQSLLPASGTLIFWMNNKWTSASEQLLVKNGASSQALAMSMPALTFAALPDAGSGAGSMKFSIPGSAAVAFDPDAIVLTHAGSLLEVRVDSKTMRMALDSNVLRVSIASGPQCSTFNGKLDESDTAKLIGALTPQTRYRWQAPGSTMTDVRAARILSDDRDAHKGVTSEFVLHRYTTELDSTTIKLIPKDPSTGLASELMDTSGHTLQLLPDRDAAIYFDKSSYGIHASLKGRFTVQPSTSVALTVVAPAYREIILGSSGTEFFQLGKDLYNGIEFFPAQPALITFGAGSDDPSLSNVATTTWMAPCRTGTATEFNSTDFSFVAQPQDQPLYGRRDVAKATQSVDAFSVLFDPAPMLVSAPTGLPFFPFRGIRRKTLDDDARRIDSGGLAPIRSRMASISVARMRRRIGMLVNPDKTWITTPQGLLVEIDEANVWHTIKLGESDKSADGWKLVIERPKDINNQPVERWALQEALSRPDVFVVVTRNDPAHIPGADDPPFGKITLAVQIAGWPMGIGFADTGGAPPVPAPGTPPPPSPPSSFEPVMVMKLTTGCIRDFLADVGRWSLARLFNGNPESASKAAIKSLDNLKMLSEGFSPMPPEGSPADDRKIASELIKHYKELYDRISKDNWTGILIFNAETPFDKVPDQVSVVTEGGPQIKAFSVPVLGIDVSRVVPGANNEMTLEKTSAFGAIHFHSPEPLGEAGDFKFQLRTLNAVFVNTELRVFLASMQLRLSRFFGAEASTPSQPTPDNSRVLDILARYEAVATDGGTSGEYVFRALGRRTMKFENNEFLTGMSATRIDVTCSRKGTAPKRYVESRFAFWGQLEFGSKFSGLTGIRKIEFENAALIMSKTDFDIDVGKIRVDFKKEALNSDLNGLLAKFPFQLSAMRWSSSTGHSLSLPSVGFTGLSLPGLSGFGAPSFDFALELDLNLGSMGKLFEAADFLKAKILVGWYDVKNLSKGFSVGFRFEGGNGPLDIGINGVLRLTAESVKVQTYSNPDGIGIGLLKPQLEVMGYRVPTNPTDVLVAFIPADKDNVAWGWARQATEVGPLKLDYFAVGQRMMLVPDEAFGQDKDLKYIIDKSKGLLFPSGTPGKGEIPNIGALYTPDAGWGVVARGSVYAFNFRFVFLDGLNRYGLGLDIPGLAMVDVIYRKLSDGQGVFSAEIEPGFRTLEMGAATVTLPVFGFDAVTNGNWSLNIGYHGNDFSRGTTVQVLPFIGSGGVRFGKLDWQASYVLNSPDSPNLNIIKALQLDPVIEMSLAARIGLGKEFREGVFAAGITLSIYGIFEGAVGTPNHPKFPARGARRYIRINGTAGLLLEIFGVARFSLVSAAVSIRVWVEAGVAFESYAPVLFHAEAGVSVFVRFVIAKFSAFGKSWEIAINFSFATRVRFSQKIIDSFDGPPPDLGVTLAPTPAMLAQLAYKQAQPLEEVQPLKWVCHNLQCAPADVPCAVSAEPMMSGATPVMLPMLLASGVADTNGLGGFCVYLFEWALRLSKNVDPQGQTPARVTLAELETLSGRVTPPVSSLSRWGDTPLDFAVLSEFFETHLVLRLMNVPALLTTQAKLMHLAGKAAPTTAQGVLLPWFADIAMNGAFDEAAPVNLRDFRGTDATTITKAWEDKLHDMLAEAIPDYPKDEKTKLKLDYLQHGLHTLQAGAREALDVITEDWAAAIVQGIVHQALRIAREMSKPATLGETAPSDLSVADLLAKLKAPQAGGSICIQVAQHASTFLHHGLRVPSVDMTSSMALPALLKTELELAGLKAQGKDCVLSFAARPGFTKNWIKGSTTLEVFDTFIASTDLPTASTELTTHKVKLTLELEDSIPGKTTQPRRFVASNFVPFGKPNAPAAALRMVAVPEALFALSQCRTHSLKIEAALEDPQGGSAPVPFTPRWYVKLEIRLEAAASCAAAKQGVAPRAIYSVLSVDPRIRELMAAMNTATGTPFSTKVRLGFKVEGEQQAIPFHFLQDDEAFFFISNLSSEPRPPQPLVANATAPVADAPSFSRLDNCMAIAQMLWMAYTVNSPGFHLGFEKNDPIAHLFKSESIASVSAIFELAALPKFLPMVDGLLLDAVQAAPGWVVSMTTPEVLELVSGTPDGQVAIVVTRENPLHGLRKNAPLQEQNWRYLAARYELVDYWTKPSATALDLARDSVMPVRVHMDEKQQAEAEAKEPQTWSHRLLVPLAEISHRTLMRAAAAGSTPPPRPNPYQFVGTELKALVYAGVRDGAGHLLEDGKVDATWNGETKILYRDTIFKLQELPGVSSSWTVAKAGTSAAEVEFSIVWNPDLLFTIDAKEATRASVPIPADRKQAFLDQFRRCVDMVTMADFSVKILMLLDDAPLGQALAARAAFLQWLKNICAELEAPNAKAQRCVLPKLQLPQALLTTPTAKPVLISALIEFKRDENLCDKREKNPDVWLATSPIGPKKLQTDKDWEEWSLRIRDTFGSTFTLLRKVEGRTEPSRTRKDGGLIFLIRRSMLSVRSAKATTAAYFAPTPLAKTFLSGSANVPTPNGPPTDFEVRDVDLNATAKRASDALETLLAGAAGEALCRIAAPVGVYSRLTKAKKGMADKMAERLKTVVADTSQVPPETRIKFRDACRADTRSAFAPTAVVTVKLPGLVLADNKVFLWGAVNVAPPLAIDPALAFTPIRIPLTATGIAGRFDVVARWADPGSNPLARITGAMSFKPRYVEVQSVEDVVGYRPSDWYEVLWTGEIGSGKSESISIQPASGSDWQIPLPLRLVPPTPAILRHNYDAPTLATTIPLADYIAKARKWEYQLSFLAPKENHDTAIATVRFDDVLTGSSVSTNNLFAALAAFVKYEKLVAELTEQLATGGVPDAGNLELAASIFERIAVHLADVDVRPTAQSSSGRARVVNLTTVLPHGKAMGEVNWAVDPVPDRPVEATLLDISNVDETELPIAADENNPGQARYKALPGVTTAFAGIANLSPRRLSFSSLDVMIESRATPSLVARRNANLLSGTTIADDFIFETANIRTPDSLVPHLSYVGAYDISTGDRMPRSVGYWLEQIDSRIFDGAARAGFAIDVSARLRLRLVQDSPGFAIYFRVPLPSIKGVPARKDSADTSDNWYRTLAGHLLTQIRRLETEAVQNGFLELTVQVFAMTGPESKRPTLSLENLQVPLAKLSVASAFEDLYLVRRSATDAPPTIRQVAAYTYARSRALPPDDLEAKLARRELATFALSLEGTVLSNEALPSAADLATVRGRANWVESMASAAEAMGAAGRSRYAALLLGPADARGSAPAPNVRHWAMAVDPSLAVKVAGPMTGKSQDGRPLGNVYLWGIARPSGKRAGANPIAPAKPAAKKKPKKADK